MIVDIGFAFYGIVAVSLSVVSAVTLRWMLHAWRSSGTAPDQSQPTGPQSPVHSFSLLVPARYEAHILRQTLVRLCALDHPDFEVVVIVGHDDDQTSEVAHSLASRVPKLSVVVDRSWPKTKPKALNAGLSACTKEVVGIFDAEDQASIDVLRLVDSALERSGAGVVQVGVQLATPRASWFALRNCLEYFLFFHSRLHAHAAKGFFPLGGNTVFVRRQLLEEVGGWDGDCLAEDCELGFRLAAHGARMAVVSDPYVSTREETPVSLSAFIRQRTRWNQGYLQVFRKGLWRRLSTRRQAAVAGYVLAFPFIQAATCVLVPASLLAMALLRIPLPLAMLGIVPALMTLAIVAAELEAARELYRVYHLGWRGAEGLRLVASTIPYLGVLSFAAARAIWRELRGARGWEKTTHVGAHLSGTANAAGIASLEPASWQS